MGTVPSRQVAFILGDFNCRAGCQIRGQAAGGDPRVLGPFGFLQKNANGDLLLQVCEDQGLKVLNTWFAHDENHLTN